MTKGCFGSEVVDTGPFRTAIQMYLMGIFGIKDDAVMYSRINKVLQQPHKVYIKKMMCEPQTITLKETQDLTKLQPEELAHISIIVMETKRRVELIYFTKALSCFMHM